MFFKILLFEISDMEQKYFNELWNLLNYEALLKCMKVMFKWFSLHMWFVNKYFWTCQNESTSKKLWNSFKMYDTHAQVVFSVLVCGLLRKTFELMLQIWKVGISSVHVALVLRKYNLSGFLSFNI